MVHFVAEYQISLETTERSERLVDASQYAACRTFAARTGMLSALVAKP